MSEGEQPMSSAIENKPKKIGGYDRWDVEEAVKTMQRADEIRADDKFLKVVIAEMGRESEKLDESASLLKKVGDKLKDIRKENKKDKP